MILRLVNQLFSQPRSHRHYLGKSTSFMGVFLLIVGFTAAIFPAIVLRPPASEILTHLATVLLGVGASLFALGAGMVMELRDPSDEIHLFSNRTKSESVMRRIIKNSGKTKGKELKVLAIAGTDFLNLGSSLEKELEEAVKAGKKVQMLLLDPMSEACGRRQEYEKGRDLNHVNTIETIQNCLDRAYEWSKGKLGSGKVYVRVYKDPSCFLMFNENEMLIHPYLTSTTGHNMPTHLVLKGSDAYYQGKVHFDNLWNREDDWEPPDSDCKQSDKAVP